MVLTLNDAISHMEHALAGDVADLSILHMVNGAGRYLIGMHTWKWQDRPAVYLNTRAAITGSSATTSTTDLTLTDAFADYTWVEGDTVRITRGTGTTFGVYRIVSRTDDDTVVLDSSPGDATDVGFDTEYGLSACALPSDFGRITSLSASDSLIGSVRLTSFDQLLFRRTDSVVTTNQDFWAALAYSVPSAGGAPVPRLELWPSPPTNDTDQFSMLYRAKWADLSTDSQIVSIPDYCEMLFLNICRAVAQGYEEADTASVDARIGEITAGPVFRAARIEDGLSQRSYGRIRGGHMDVRGENPIWHNGIIIGGPS